MRYWKILYEQSSWNVSDSNVWITMNDTHLPTFQIAEHNLVVIHLAIKWISSKAKLWENKLKSVSFYNAQRGMKRKDQIPFSPRPLWERGRWLEPPLYPCFSPFECVQRLKIELIEKACARFSPILWSLTNPLSSLGKSSDCAERTSNRRSTWQQRSAGVILSLGWFLGKGSKKNWKKYGLLPNQGRGGVS